MVVGMLVMVLGAIGIFLSYFNPSNWLVIISVSAVGIGFGGAMDSYRQLIRRIERLEKKEGN